MHSPSVEKPNFGGNLLFHPLQHRQVCQISHRTCAPLSKYHTSGAAPRPITVNVGGRRPHRRRHHRCRRRQAVATDNAAGAAITNIAAADIVTTATAAAAAAISVAASFS